MMGSINNGPGLVGLPGLLAQPKQLTGAAIRRKMWGQQNTAEAAKVRQAKGKAKRRAAAKRKRKGAR